MQQLRFSSIDSVVRFVFFIGIVRSCMGVHDRSSLSVGKIERKIRILVTIHGRGKWMLLERANDRSINTVRKLLHKFYNHSLITLRRFRDKDTGLFIFQWRLQPELFEAFVQWMRQKILKKLRTKLEYEVRIDRNLLNLLRDRSISNYK